MGHTPVKQGPVNGRTKESLRRIVTTGDSYAKRSSNTGDSLYDPNTALDPAYVRDTHWFSAWPSHSRDSFGTRPALKETWDRSSCS